MKNSIGIANITYYLPSKKTDLTTLQDTFQLESSIEQLRSLGFSYARIAVNETHMTLAARSMKKLFKQSNIEPNDIDLFLFAGALPESVSVLPPRLHKSLDIFKYSASKLQYDFGMANASTVALSQQGCVSTMSAVWMARNTLFAEDSLQKALCVSSDVLPPITKREIIYNIISDASCSIVIDKHALQNEILSYVQVSKGYYWDADAKKNELVASYFPTAKLVIQKALLKANLTISDIDWIIPHNVNMRSWEILLGILGFPKEKLFGDNIEKKGHTIAADNFINLKDACDKGVLKKGQLLLLFTFGFGAHWSCLILRH